MEKSSKTGPVLIMIAAALWALDALLRTTLTKTIPAASIVFLEHTVGFILLSPLLWRARAKLKTLVAGDWVRLLFLTIVSSVAGTLLFTQALAISFASYDFATPILLQKLQPIFVIILAAIFLREKLSFRFLALVPVALIGSYLISFGAQSIPFQWTNKELVYVLALGAAITWGAGTILSKKILLKLSFSEATAIRFLLAIPISYIAAMLLHQTFPLTSVTGGNWIRFVIIAFTTGAGAVLIYYKGLQKTEAKIATMAELVFPVVGILIAITALNPYGAPQTLSLANIFGIIILLISVLMISFDYASISSQPQENIAAN